MTSKACLAPGPTRRVWGLHPVRLTRRPAALVGVLAAVSLLALASGPAAVTTAAKGPVLGPSGLPAVQKTYHAGQGPGEDERPNLASPEAVISDRDSVADQLAYHRQAQALPVGSPQLNWKNVGPYGMDDPPGYPSGTIRFARAAGMGATVAVDPRDTSGNTVYIGNMGGLWKSSNGGTSWAHLGDEFARTAVGAIAVDPSNPNNVYVGTGIALLTVSGDAAGAGIYVSHDAGRHFTRPARNVRGYGTNAISVTPAGTIVAATNRGLWASTDKGATFTEVKLPSNATHTGQAVGAYSNWVSAAVVHPTRTSEVTVAVGLGYGKRIGPDGKPLSVGNGLYRSTNGVKGPYTYVAGSSQFQSKNPRASSDAIGRIALAYGAKAGEQYVLWALVSDAGLLNKRPPAGQDFVGSTTGQSLNPTNSILNGAFRSDDDGANWTLKATPENLQTAVNESLVVYAALGYSVGVQGFYNLWIAGDPKNSDQMYLGLEEVFQSTANAGTTPGLASFEVIQRYWDLCGSTTYFDNVTEGVACPDGTPKYSGVSTHPDQHVGLPVPTASGVRLYTGNDGGFYRQDSHALPEGRTGFDNNGWTDMNKLATTQGYQAARKSDGEFLIANQDNGAGFFKAGGQEILVSSGDGVQTAATSNPDVWYSSAQGLILYVTKNHGKDITQIKPDNTGAAFLSPFVVDPTDENHLVAAARDIKESLKGPNTAVLSDPAAGTVVQSDWVTSFDAGNTPYKNGTATIAWTAQSLAVRGAVVYAAMCGLCRNSLGDPSLIHSTVATNVKPGCTPKKGAADCWHLAAGKGLPHVGMSAVTIDPKDTKTIYATFNENSLVGLDKKVVGSARVMVSHNAGESFTDLTGNLPGSNARDVVVRNGQLVVAGDNGIFTAPLTGKSWKRLAAGLPQTRVYDLDLDRTGRYLTASVYGRGVWVLDFQAKATSSSSGPGKTGGPVASPPPSGGGSLAATGLRARLPWAAGGVLVLGLVLIRRRRHA
jgi:hypothetical protein